MPNTTGAPRTYHSSFHNPVHNTLSFSGSGLIRTAGTNSPHPGTEEIILSFPMTEEVEIGETASLTKFEDSGKPLSIFNILP